MRKSVPLSFTFGTFPFPQIDIISANCLLRKNAFYSKIYLKCKLNYVQRFCSENLRQTKIKIFGA